MTQGHQLNNLGSTPVPEATNPSFKAFGQSISREDFILKPFTILGCHFGYGIGDYFCGCYIYVHFCGFIKQEAQEALNRSPEYTSPISNI